MHLVINTKHKVDISIDHYVAYIYGFVDNTGKVLLGDGVKHVFNGFDGEATYTAPFPPKQLPNGKFMAIPDFSKSAITSTPFLYNIIYHDIVKKKIVATLKPKTGKYTDAADLAKELGNTEFNKYFKIYYMKPVNKFRVTSLVTSTDTLKYILKFHGGLNDVLGYTERKFNAKYGVYHTAPLMVDLERGITNIYIYCDLCEHIRVGDTTAPLLRPIAFNAHKYGEMVHMNYVKPMYVPLNKSYINSIEITLCDTAGDVLGFVEGITTAVLHFKRA